MCNKQPYIFIRSWTNSGLFFLLLGDVVVTFLKIAEYDYIGTNDDDVNDGLLSKSMQSHCNALE